MLREWFVLKTKPHSERQAEAVLIGKGIEVYLPLIKNLAARRLHARLEPLFPGYIFGHLDLELDELLVARSAPGIVYILGTEGRPSPVPDEIVKGVRARLMASGNLLPPKLNKGDPVVIVGGPLAGLEAIFDARLNGEGRSRVLLMVLGRMTPLDTSIHNLRRAG